MRLRLRLLAAVLLLPPAVPAGAITITTGGFGPPRPVRALPALRAALPSLGGPDAMALDLLETFPDLKAADAQIPVEWAARSLLGRAKTVKDEPRELSRLIGGIEQLSAQAGFAIPYELSRELERALPQLRERRGKAVLNAAAALAKSLAGPDKDAGAVAAPRAAPIEHIVVDARHIWSWDKTDPVIGVSGDVAFAEALAEGLLSEGFKGRVTVLVNDRRLTEDRQASLFGFTRQLESDYRDDQPVDLWIAPVTDPMLLSRTRIPSRVRTGDLTTTIVVPMADEESENLSFELGRPVQPGDADGYLGIGGRVIALRDFSRVLGVARTDWDELRADRRTIARELLAAATRARLALQAGEDIAAALSEPLSGTRYLKLSAAEPRHPAPVVVIPQPLPAAKSPPQPEKRSWRFWAALERLLR